MDNNCCLLVYGDPARDDRLLDSIKVAKNELEKRSFSVLQTAKFTYLDQNRIEPAILSARAAQIPLIVICGGTGIGPEDVIPQLLGRIGEYEIPGVGEWLRRKSEEKSPVAWIGRGGAWISGSSVILAIPGSPGAIGECFEILEPMLPKLLKARRGQCDKRP